MECIFCNIVNKKADAEILFEDENIIAFLDIQPINYGHTLVVPKKHYDNFMVEIGGEVYASGNKTNGELWKIGIDSPNLHSLPGQKIQAILSLKNIAVATSGDYRNYFEYNGKLYSHTIDPKSGYPVTHNLASVTVIARNCMQADALATAIMVMGKERGMDYIEKIDNAEAYFISRKSSETYEI